MWSGLLRTSRQAEGLDVEPLIVAFGSGALGSAVAFALVLKALSLLPGYELTVVFLAGTISFMALDMLIVRMGSSLAHFCS